MLFAVTSSMTWWFRRPPMAVNMERSIVISPSEGRALRAGPLRRPDGSAVAVQPVRDGVVQVMTAESMFVNTAGPASSCGSAVTTVRLRTATTHATESTSTSASRLPFAAAASTPDWRRASWPESNDTPRLSSLAWAWAENRIPSWPPSDSAKLGPPAGAVVAGRAAGRTPSTVARPPARETGERRGSATLLDLLDVAGRDVLVADYEQRAARARLDGVHDAAVDGALVVQPRDGLADHGDGACEVLPRPRAVVCLFSLLMPSTFANCASWESIWAESVGWSGSWWVIWAIRSFRNVSWPIDPPSSARSTLSLVPVAPKTVPVLVIGVVMCCCPSSRCQWYVGFGAEPARRASRRPGPRG